MDVLKHIKEEHEEFRSMMKEIESAKGKKKENLFQELDAKIHGHHEAEETVIFSKVKEKVKGEDEMVVMEMIEEHHLGKHQFEVLEGTRPEDETWDAKFSVLMEVLEHHMKEEEREFMPLARKVMPKEWLEESLNEFEAVHEEKMKEKELVVKR